MKNKKLHNLTECIDTTIQIIEGTAKGILTPFMIPTAIKQIKGYYKDDTINSKPHRFDSQIISATVSSFLYKSLITDELIVHELYGHPSILQSYFPKINQSYRPAITIFCATIISNCIDYLIENKYKTRFEKNIK